MPGTNVREDPDFWFHKAVFTAESHSTQPVDFPDAWRAAVTSFL